jgi:hypothetical protein
LNVGVEAVDAGVVVIRSESFVSQRHASQVLVFFEEMPAFPDALRAFMNVKRAPFVLVAFNLAAFEVKAVESRVIVAILLDL